MKKLIPLFSLILAYAAIAQAGPFYETHIMSLVNPTDTSQMYQTKKVFHLGDYGPHDSGPPYYWPDPWNRFTPGDWACYAPRFFSRFDDPATHGGYEEEWELETQEKCPGDGTWWHTGCIDTTCNDWRSLYPQDYPLEWNLDFSSRWRNGGLYTWIVGQPFFWVPPETNGGFIQCRIVMRNYRYENRGTVSNPSWIGVCVNTLYSDEFRVKCVNQ